MSNEKRPLVAILMSTYNGEKYIDEQIQSILSQENVYIHIYIRDDGSSDNTINVIQSYQKKHPEEIDLFIGENIGFANSFYYLIKKNFHADYYAFCDQDDIWDNNKIDSAIKQLNDGTEACLYASNVNIFRIKSQKKELLFNTRNKEIVNNYKRYFYIFNPLGCTMVWDKKLQNILMHYKKPDLMTHDTWINIIANCKGKLIFDLQPHMDYRIHENNTCGTAVGTSFINKVRKYVKRYFLEKKKLNISFTCKYIQKEFPLVKFELMDIIANYDTSIINYLKALFYVSIHKNIPIKGKIIILMIIRKL